MTSPPTKLRLELEEAKRHLRTAIEDESFSTEGPATLTSNQPERQALSKLNTLLGKSSVPQRPLSLFQNLGVPQRPTYDVIAHRILGPDVGAPTSFLDTNDNYSTHVAQRLAQLRERLEAKPLPDEQTSNDGFVGVESDGTPVWAQVLNEQRGRLSSTLNEELAPLPSDHVHHPARVVNNTAEWPKRMNWSSSLTFKQWFVAEENLEATQFCEHVIDLPAGGLNPLFLLAEPHSGCSHLLHATGQALIRRGEGHVVHITAADAATVEGLEAEWQDALSGASALLIDDVHEFAQNVDWKHQLGVLVDHALNLGLQVVVGSRMAVEDFESSRLKDVLRDSTVALLTAPQAPSLMAYARWRCTQKNLLVSDRHLAQLSRIPPLGWRAIEGRLERLAMAFERGAVLLDHDDLTDVLDGGRTPEHLHESQRVDDLAQQLVGDALDTVYSSIDVGGIDLHSPLEAWEEDEYAPPEWQARDLGEQSEAFERRLRAAVDPVQPSQPSVLDVHERERYIVKANDPLKRGDLGRAVDMLVDLEESIDERMNASTAESVSSSLELQHLEEQMVVLAQRAVEADIDELITIADELRTLEERLVELDPEREPLPVFEEKPVRIRRTPVRRKKRVNESKHDGLDTYEPDGEWDIDGTGIEAEDLLEEEPESVNIRLSRIHPRTVLMGEEE
jgi:chromosomal replication initiation ATPase DnaA